MPSRFALFAVVSLAFTTQIGFTEEPTRKDATAELLAKLRKPIDIGKNNDELRITEFSDFVTDKFGVAIVINSSAFANTSGEAVTDMMVKMPKSKGLPLATVLRQVLSEKNATFLVRKGHIEIVPISTAAKEAKVTDNDENGVHLAQPLLSAIYKEKPINEALADLAEEYDLTIVVSPQAGDNKAGFVNARLLNVPADKAIELLAVQADLRVIKTGNAFLVTSKDHANELFNERFEQEQKQVELERMRNTPYAPPATIPPPAPAPAAPAPVAPPK